VTLNSSTNPGTGIESISRILGPGTWYLRVYTAAPAADCLLIMRT
jgi:hypothetical protein